LNLQFASPIPWWVAALAAAAIAGVAYWSYRRPTAPLSPLQRAALVSLRVSSLAAVVFFLCRPVVLLPPQTDASLVVPVLVDVSRSMRIADADGRPRLARAVDAVERDIVPALDGTFKIEVFALGDVPAPARLEDLKAEARHSRLAEAVDSIRERYRGRRVPGIVLLSDGSTTSSAPAGTSSLPLIAVGVGSPDGPPDREIVSLSAGEPLLDQSSIDLNVSAAARGYGRSPFQVRIHANGQLIDSRALTPAAEGSPVEATITVAPDPTVATVYTAEIAPAEGETIVENNSRSVLVSPTGRKRRVLTLAAAPGHEFSFLTRALTSDPGLEVDSIVRKGQDDRGQPTFLVQAGAGRASALTSGFPDGRETLYTYDGLIVVNLEGDFFTRAQLAMAAEFVSVRGGGLVVLGARSFAQRGLLATPLAEALPVELADRRMVGGSSDEEGLASANRVTLTLEGETHSAMRIGRTVAETRASWAALPPLAASAALGGPKPGATVLAMTSGASGERHPLVAVQRYGRGRTMVFGGEASWRWRMLLPATNRSYEQFWRQVARWLVRPAPDPVSAALPEAAEPGDAVEIGFEARDAAFAPVADADVTANITLPGGEVRPLTLRRQPDAAGSFSAQLALDAPGVYRVRGEARRGARSLGLVDAWFHVGGADREFADPRLNESFLRRLARASGGEYLPVADAGRIGSILQAAAPGTLEPERRDLWHAPWAFALVVALLSAEWILRRRWGLR
jgi:uncharacterized membrane protein